MVKILRKPVSTHKFSLYETFLFIMYLGLFTSTYFKILVPPLLWYIEKMELLKIIAVYHNLILLSPNRLSCKRSSFL